MMRYRDDGKLAEFLTATRRLHLLTPPFGTTWHYYEVVNRIETRFNEGKRSMALITTSASRKKFMCPTKFYK